MGIPAQIVLDWQPDQRGIPFVSNLRTRIYIDDNSGTELGTAYDTNLYRANDPRLENDLMFEWRGTMASA